MTPSAASLRHLERLARRFAAWFSAAVAVLVCAVFIGVAYHDEVKLTTFRAQLAAGRLADFAYIQGPTWEYNGHRVPELLAGLDPTGVTRQTVFNASGRMIGETGGEVSGLSVEAAAPILNGPAVLGQVKVHSDINHLSDLALLGTLLGALLGLAVYGFALLVPLRLLERTLESLRRTEADLVGQVEVTQMALEEASAERQRAQEASQAKSQFVSSMSHEFRTPLNAIIGFSDILKEELFGPLAPKYKGYARDINESGRHLASVVDDVLDMSKAEANKHVLRIETVNPAELLDESIRLLSSAAEDTGVELSHSVGPDVPPSIRADPTKVKQILLNLLSNAIKFTPRGGRVEGHISLLGDDRIEITVRDTGIGMTEDEIEVAFEIFGQNSNPYLSLAGGHRGTGLGLPIARELAKLHGGTLVLVSKPRRGTAAILTLPIALGAEPSDATGPTVPS